MSCVDFTINTSRVENPSPQGKGEGRKGGGGGGGGGGGEMGIVEYKCFLYVSDRLLSTCHLIIDCKVFLLCVE